MCTLVVAFRHFDGVPLVVAANRDEFLARPSHPPAWRQDGPLAVFAGRDGTAGGTWLGFNERGVFAAITNRWPAPNRDDRRSRGLLVLDALAEADAATAADRVAEHPGDRHNGFHLIIADRERAELVWGDGTTLHRRALEPGIHVVTERSLRPPGEEGAVQTPMGPVVPMPPTRELDLRAHPLLAPGPEPDVEALRDLVRRHASDPFDGPCVHALQFPYGTRSSTLFRLGADGAVRFHFADGPPCTTDWNDLRPSASRPRTETIG
jgi:uncharacterized protein with NRDE domain